MRRAAAIGAIAILGTVGGCAAIAGYDFGSYKARGDGGGGAGGGATTSSTVGGGGTNQTSSGSTGGSIGGSSSTGGGGIGGAVNDVVIYAGDDPVSSLALEGSSIYFSLAKTKTAPTIERRDKDGMNGTTLASGVNVGGTLSIDGSYLYFIQTDTSVMTRLDKSGGQPKPLSPNPFTSVFAAGSLAFGARSDVEQLDSVALSSLGESPFVTNAGSLTVVTADADGVYWLVAGDISGMTSSVMATSLSGGASLTIATMQLYPFLISSDANNVYWTTFKGGVFGADKHDGSKSKTYSTPNQLLDKPVGGIAAFGDTLYFTRDDSVFAVPISGAAADAVKIRSGIDGPTYVAVDADSICYTVQPTNPNSQSMLIRIPR